MSQLKTPVRHLEHSEASLILSDLRRRDPSLLPQDDITMKLEVGTKRLERFELFERFETR